MNSKKLTKQLTMITASFCLTAGAAAADYTQPFKRAGSLDLSLDIPNHANGNSGSDGGGGVEPKVDLNLKNDKRHFEEPMFSGNKVHQYLGVSALALVGVAMLAPKEEGGLHENAAKGAALLGAAAASSGLIYHWNDYDIRDGILEPDNLHVILATTGAVGLLYAAAKGPDTPHAGVGALAGISMAVAIKMTW